MSPWSDPDRWNRLCSGADCPFCAAGWPGDVAVELATAYLTVPASAILPGYCCLIHRRHVVELHDLTAPELTAFMLDVRRVSAVVKRVTAAYKLNLASYGNLVPHLHMHICPRRPGDRFDGRVLDFGATDPGVYAAGEHARYVDALRIGLGSVGEGGEVSASDP